MVRNNYLSCNINSNMDSTNRLSDFINEITKTYDKIRSFESEKCTQEQLEKELRHIRDVAGDYPTMVSVMVKESPANLPILRDFISSLKPQFTNAINMQLMVLSMQNGSDEKWIKPHVAMALASINNNNYIDSLKGCKEFLRLS